VHPADPAASAADVLGGEWRETGGHRYLVIDTHYWPGHRHGRVAVADCLPDEDGLWPRLSLLAGPPKLYAEADRLTRRESGRLLFVDVETTGLAGGAGTYAFLVGCGWFESAGFRIRQFFLASCAAERALLQGIAGAVAGAAALVTYNGKTFDLPLIETRFLFHRMANCLGDLPHIDMLHPARCLWRSDRHDPDSSCRLAAMEETLLGHVRGGDVPGFEIPSRYFHYVRTSDPRPLSVVLEHNRLDVLALAMLTARAARLLDEGAGAARAAREALGLGRLYERGGMTAEARACYARAADFRPAEAGPHDVSESDVVTRAEALRAYAVLCRRDRDFEEAAAAWRELLDLYSCPARLVREATEALAVHHEHRARNLPAARGFAVKSLEFAMTAARAQAVRYRLARLDRKLAVSPYPALVF
jgi:uncharacterized protein YprB with RNaseH-like and TPR domain